MQDVAETTCALAAYQLRSDYSALTTQARQLKLGDSGLGNSGWANSGWAIQAGQTQAWVSWLSCAIRSYGSNAFLIRYC